MGGQWLFALERLWDDEIGQIYHLVSRLTVYYSPRPNGWERQMLSDLVTDSMVNRLEVQGEVALAEIYVNCRSIGAKLSEKIKSVTIQPEFKEEKVIKIALPGLLTE